MRRPAARKGALIVVLMVLVATGLQAYLSYRAFTEETSVSLSRAAEAIDYQTASSLKAIDELLADLTERLSISHWPDGNQLSWLSGRLGASPAIDSALVIDRQGRTVGPGVTAQGLVEPPALVVDRNYYLYYRDHQMDRDSRVGAPFVSALDGNFVLPVARGYFDPLGHPAGLVRITVAPKVLLNEFAALVGEEGTSSAVFFQDGTLLSSFSPHDPDFASAIESSDLLRARPADSAAGYRDLIGPTGQERRLIAYRRMTRFNLVVVTGMRLQEAYAPWRRQIYRNIALAVVVCAMVAIIAIAADRREAQRILSEKRASEARHRAERVRLQLSEAIGNLADAIALFDSEDNLVVCNTAYAEAFGFPDSPPAPGAAFADIAQVAAAGWRDIDPAMEERHRVATGDPAVVQTADGSWVQIRECRTKDGGTLTIRSDITGLKRREEDLRNLEHRTALILEAAGDGIVDLDSDGRIGLVNRAAGDILGYAGSSLTGLPVNRLFADGEDVDITATSVDAAFRRADGTFAQVQYQATPIVEDGRTAGAVMVFRDVALQRKYEADLADHQRDLAIQVTERTAELQRENAVRARTEAALRASRERLRSITDSLFHCVLVFNYAGHVVFANVAARRMLKVEDQEVEGLPMDYLFQLVSNGEAVPFDGSPLRDAVHGTVMHDNDACLRVADGREIPVAYVCTPLMEEGHRRSAVMSFRDITDIKQAQWEAMQASRLASVGQLAAGIAHEINTPIQYIGNNLGFIGDSVRDLLAQLSRLREGGDVPAGDQSAFLAEELPLAIAESIEGVEQIGRIVLSMKEFSHPGSAGKSLTNINRALETTLTVTTNVWKLVAQVERHFDPDLPPVPCHAGEMNQVFLNLIVNAVHAIEASGKPAPGKITLTTTRRENHVEIGIEDSGTGIPAAIREKIFDPFYTTKEVGKGTGQGLAICLDVVVHKHGGKITVGGAEGEGALFVIALPLEDATSERSA